MAVYTVLTSWLVALGIQLLRITCTVRFHDDPRAALRERGQRYVYSVLHAHQVATIMVAERGTGAMVSRSPDGDVLIPSLRAGGVVPVRGSTRLGKRAKGGRAALEALIRHVRAGSPAYMAVDGPRGPRNGIQPGISVLSHRTGAAVLDLVTVPRRRWILERTWDRFQIPKPFSRIDLYFADPLFPREDEDIDAFGRRIEATLNDLEQKHDAAEAVFARTADRPRTDIPVGRESPVLREASASPSRGR